MSTEIKVEKKEFNPKKFWIIMFAVFAAGIILDQATKLYFENFVEERSRIPIIGEYFYLTFVKNNGASFGMLADNPHKNIVFFIITLIGVPAFCYILYSRRGSGLFGSIGLALVISGAFGNAIDRFKYSVEFYDGYVRDFIAVKGFAVFNIADSCMCVGVAMLAVALLFLDDDALFRKKEQASVAAEDESKAEETLVCDGCCSSFDADKVESNAEMSNSDTDENTSLQ